MVIDKPLQDQDSGFPGSFPHPHTFLMSTQSRDSGRACVSTWEMLSRIFLIVSSFISKFYGLQSS